MKEQEIKEYLEKLNGKVFSSVSPKTPVFSDNDFSYELIRVIKNDGHSDEGVYRTFEVAEKYGFKVAVLKTKKIYSKCEQQFKLLEVDKNLELNRMLIGAGAKIAKMYAMFYADDRYIELQELILGKPLTYTNIEKLTLNALGYVNFDDLTAEEKVKVDNEYFRYSLEMQQKLIKAPQSFFNDLLHTHMLFKKMGFVFDDAHAGNVLFGPNGFTLIDIDYSQVNEDMLKFFMRPTEAQTLQTFLYPFTNTTENHKFSSVEHKKVLQKNNQKIFKKLTDAISERNIVVDYNFLTGETSCDKNSCAMHYVNAIGLEDFAKNYKYILASQIKLRKKLGLPQDYNLTDLKNKQKLILSGLKPN